MERDIAAELDRLKEEVQEIKQMLSVRHLPLILPKLPKEDSDLLIPESREKLNELRDQLLADTSDQNKTGAVAYTGTFRSGEGEAAQQSVWTSLVSTNDLLSMNDHRMVEKVLTSIGNSQRLAIVLALLKKPMTASQLMEVLGSNTTGQIYHHLKPLVSADIIKEEKGTYAVIPHRVQGIMMLLAGVWDLIDPRYTSGTWEEQTN